MLPACICYIASSFAHSVPRSPRSLSFLVEEVESLKTRLPGYTSLSVLQSSSVILSLSKSGWWLRFRLRFLLVTLYVPSYLKQQIWSVGDVVGTFKGLECGGTVYTTRWVEFRPSHISNVVWMTVKLHELKPYTVCRSNHIFICVNYPKSHS